MRKKILLCILLFLAAALLVGCQRKRIAQNARLESFLYETIGTAMDSETSLSIVREDDGYVVTGSLGEGNVIRTAPGGWEIAAQAMDILRRHDAHLWNGYAKSDPFVLDGTSFTLSITLDDETTISARGTNSYPKGLPAALREIEDLFDRFLRESEQ